tara:strand:- start:20589 stop:21788 length:1200 start_codon:yes stop_codon:yes gene_type:complete
LKVPKEKQLSDYINELTLYYGARPERQYDGMSKALSLLLWWLVAFPALFTITAIYSFILFIFPRKVDRHAKCEAKICVARTFATSSKLGFLEEESVRFFSENPFSKLNKSNIYNLPFKHRLIAFFRSFSVFFKDFPKLSSEASNYLPLRDSFRAIKLYIPRFAHKVNFTSYFSELLDLYNPTAVITGNKEDRFALSEQTICKEKGIKLVCYPHGLEYAIQLPRGVVGDAFYCYSQATKKYYEEIYKSFDQTFIYSPEVVQKLLGRQVEKKNVERRVVFFPESRGKDINLMIVSLLLEKGLDVYLKLHPLDSADSYIELGLPSEKIIEDFNQAILGNVILARKSTVLLEAIYSGSLSCALLFNSEDNKAFHEQFPSLWDDRIKQVTDIDELMQWLSSKLD